MKSPAEAARLFQIWAPPGVVWSRWVKPVIFAQDVQEVVTASSPSVAAKSSKGEGVSGRWPGEEAAASGWSPSWANYLATLPLDPATALVVDLPGADAVEVGLLLATAGMRPTPLFNTCNGPNAVVNLNAMIERLAQGATTLAQRPLPVNAPPAFLLDSRRNGGLLPPEPGEFDNRWLIFPYDFPSATFLAAQGIERIILLHDSQAEDLKHVLVRWYEAGLTLLTQRWLSRGPLQPYQPSRPAYFRQLWYVFLTTLAHRLRYSNVGGFGAVLLQGNGGRSG